MSTETTSNDPTSLLADIARRLSSQEGVDAELASVLATHILVADSKETAVAQAKGEIIALAERRAAPKEEENGDSDA